jgi:ribonuclease HI
MGWIAGSCKGKDVWVKVGPEGRPVVDGGRVPIRYSKSPGAKIYRAGQGNIQLTGSEVLELDAGVSADAGKKSKSSGFGSAGTRTQAQAAMAAEAARKLLTTFSADAAVCFTDGACKGNPGPCGAGAVVRLPDGKRLEAFRALGMGTNNVGELTAIGLAIDMLDEVGFDQTAPVEILTDSKYSNGVLTLGWKAKANKELIQSVKNKLGKRRVRVHWIAGHVGIDDNERADALANMGVHESRSM